MEYLFPFHMTGSLRGRRGVSSIIAVVFLNTVLLAVYTATVTAVVKAVA